MFLSLLKTMRGQLVPIPGSATVSQEGEMNLLVIIPPAHSAPSPPSPPSHPFWFEVTVYESSSSPNLAKNLGCSNNFLDHIPRNEDKDMLRGSCLL